MPLPSQARAQALDRLAQAVVRHRQRDAEEALAVRAVGAARRERYAGFLEHQLAVGGRGVSPGNGRPDVDGAPGWLDFHADLAQRIADEIAAALIESGHPLGRPGVER